MLASLGIGAAGGAAIGLVTGFGIVEGLLIGAGTGGLVGAFGERRLLDFVNPVWHLVRSTPDGEGDGPIALAPPSREVPALVTL